MKLRSSLAKHQLNQPADDEQLKTMRRKAWREQGVAMLRPEDVQDDWTRQVIVNTAEKLYGKRKGKACDERS